MDGFSTLVAVIMNNWLLLVYHIWLLCVRMPSFSCGFFSQNKTHNLTRFKPITKQNLCERGKTNLSACMPGTHI